MGGVNSPDLAGGLAAAVARLGQLAEACERDDTGDGVMETPREQARQIGADLRVVLAAAVTDDGSRCPWHGPTCDGTDHENRDPAMPLGEQAQTAEDDWDALRPGDQVRELPDDECGWSFDDRCTCTRAHGHPGQHVATGHREVFHVAAGGES